MKGKAADYLVLDPVSGTYHENPEQAVRDDVEKHYWLNVGRTIVKDWRLYVMLVPMLLVFLFWRYFPMYELLGCFKVSDSVIPVNDQLFSGFSYFKRLLVGGDSLSQNFWMAMRNTFLLSFYGLLLRFPDADHPGAVLQRGPLQRGAQHAAGDDLSAEVHVHGRHDLPGDHAGQAGLHHRPDGYRQPGAVRLGIISTEIGNAGLLNNPDYFRAIYQISGIWEEAGYGSIVFFAAIIAISPTSYEAAQIDGANKWAQMRYVVLPSILSTIVIMLITRIGSLLNIGYEKVLLLYNTKTYVTADVISTLAYRTGLGGGAGTGIASAAEMMNNVVGMLLVIGANTIARKAANTSLY